MRALAARTESHETRGGEGDLGPVDLSAGNREVEFWQLRHVGWLSKREAHARFVEPTDRLLKQACRRLGRHVIRSTPQR